MRLVLAVLACAALLVSPVAAKPKKKDIRGFEPARVAAGACRPLCAFDVTPCDPPEFKRTDGRCASPVVGGTQP